MLGSRAKVVGFVSPSGGMFRQAELYRYIIHLSMLFVEGTYGGSFLYHSLPAVAVAFVFCTSEASHSSDS